MANIDFFTFLTPNSYPFANFLRETGELMKSDKHNIQWKCVLSKGAKKYPNNFQCIHKSEIIESNPSMRHAIAIHEALKKATNDYIIISDVDIAITYKNWDDTIINILNKGYSCFGTPNASNSYGEQDFPNVPFFCFKKNILNKVNLDFRPILDENRKIKKTKKNDNQKIMGRGVGSFVFFETGCKLSSEFKKSKLKSKCLKTVKLTSENSKLFNEKNNKTLKQKIYFNSLKDEKYRISYNQLIEYHYNNKLFLAHLGNSSCEANKIWGSYNSEPGNSWKGLVKNYLKTVTEK